MRSAGSRKCLTCGCCLCLTLLLIRSTHGQIRTKRIADEDLPMDLVPKVKGFERTDLFSHYPLVLPDPPVLPDPAIIFQPPTSAQASLAVAKTAYQKLKIVNDQKPAQFRRRTCSGLRSNGSRRSSPCQNPDRTTSRRPPSI